jgi:hypothetical protein
MSIIVNNSVVNRKGTPSSITDIFSNRPTPSAVATGTLFFSTDTSVIYQSDGTTWITYGGAGSTPNLSQVLTQGNNADNYIYLENAKAFISLQNTNQAGNSTYLAYQVLVNVGTNNNTGIFFEEASGNKMFTFKDAVAYKGGFSLNLDTHLYQFGDYNNQFNGTKIYIDDDNTLIRFDTETLQFTGTLTTTNNGTAVNEHLKVTINGTDYVIQLRLA